ncbi:MAG: DUF342 domain-containing protein [Spirochaetales bacterium]|nr:MAG: DUF342 domain-containing protein [Spirochaetales bacterium]
METEKVEHRDPVTLDGRVQRSFWAPADTCVAQLMAAKTGKPGKNIYGKVIPAIQDDDTAFYLGSGLEREKGEILTRAAGWVRVGTQWADLVPFAKHVFNLRISGDGTTLLLDFTPGDKRLPFPDVGTILQEAKNKGASAECLLSEDEITAALQRAIKSSQALIGFSLSCDRDAGVRIDISPDKLTATLNVVKGRGKGKPLQLSMVSAALSEYKLKGIKLEKLKADIIAFYKSQELELCDYILVEGRAPVGGEDRSLAFGIAFLPDEQAKEYLGRIEANPALSRYLKKAEEFPLVSTDRVAVIKKDQELARFSPPSFGQPGVDVFGAIIPGAPGNDPLLHTFENIRVSRESIESDDDGLVLMLQRENETLIRVLPYRDARVDVAVSKNGMEATLSCEKEYGLGRDLSLELVQETLKAAGVSFGIETKALSDALNDAHAGYAVTERPIANGKEPIPSGGWRLIWIVKVASGAALTLRADGTADYKNQDKATIVAQGQPILEIVSIGRDGQDGTDVYGKPIMAPKDPKATDLPEWDETIREELNENGDRVLIAARNGELKFERNRLSIDTVWKIAGDIGPSSGNIRFPGPVAISGSVLTGFLVVAGGDVFVSGSVEAALVSSEGGVRIVEGVKGARRGTVRARKTIEAAFTEQALLMAIGDITLKSSALLSVVKTNGKLTLQGERGSLIGGQCRAKNGIDVQNLGAENNSRTTVSFGQDYLIKDAAEAEEREIDRVKALILKADKTMKELARNGGDMATVRQEKIKLVKLLEKRTMRVFQLHERFEEHVPSEVVVRGTIYPGAVLESHNRYHEVRVKKQRVAFAFDVHLGRIIERPLA